MNNRTIIEQYYRHHRDELLTFVGSRLGGDRVLAEDMVHELFLRLLSDDRHVISPATIHSLVMTMARNLVTDHYRHLFFQRLYAERMKASASQTYSIEPAVYARETVAHIERRLQRLPQPCADIYRLHIYGGMKCADISRHLHLDYKAVEYRLGQARREVRRLLRSG